MEKHCEVPCKTVDDKFVTVWDSIKQKVPLALFTWIIGALAATLLLFILIQLDMRGTMIEIKTTLSTSIQYQGQLHQLHGDRIKSLEGKIK